MAPALLAWQGLRHEPIDVAAIVVGSVVLFLLVVLRMAGLVAQVQDQAAQLAALAHNDGLTGVPNRRAWELELQVLDLVGLPIEGVRANLHDAPVVDPFRTTR